MYDKYDIAIIVSSDGDLIPAIDWVRKRKNKKVEYVGFSIADSADEKKSTKPLLSMIPRTDVQRIVVENDLRKFIINSK
ncbi:MAG: NYN domain-containing protein [Candidatus Vogelbacteria bacterium]|nr:NYN domain-containing protein [Candidatus Vogelbacteria bacterium]